MDFMGGVPFVEWLPFIVSSGCPAQFLGDFGMFPDLGKPFS
jgi:hypothetical protein